MNLQEIKKALGGEEIFSKVIETVKKMNAVEIISMYEPLKQTSDPKRFVALCPFHEQEEEGSFSVVTDYKRKNGEVNELGSYHCWRCDASGSGITYVINKFFKGEQKQFVQACIKIAQDAGIITLNGLGFEVHEYEKKIITVPEVHHPLKDIDHRHRMYSILLECCTLTSEDRAYLKKYRGLTDEQIDRTGYKSTPNRTIWYRQDNPMLKKGFSSLSLELYKNKAKKEDFLGVPGFYIEQKTSNKDGNEEISETITFPKWVDNCIFIPCKDAKGRIQALQIDAKAKLKENFAGPKYSWLSSKRANGTDNTKEGCPCPAAIGVVYPKELLTAAIFITEGYYKAEMMSKAFGAIVLAIPGVTNWGDVNQTLADVENSSFFKAKFDKIELIFGAFDADMVFNYKVFDGLRNMTNHILTARTVQIDYLYWDMSLGKGIDDLIMDHPNYIQHLKKTAKRGWDYAYEKAAQEAVKRSSADSIRSIPKAEYEVLMKELFWDIAFPQ